MLKTKNDLIYIGHEMEFDKAEFERSLLELSELDETDAEALRSKIGEIVPTYHRVNNFRKVTEPVS